MQLKWHMRKKRPEVKINTVVCRANYRELPAIVELAHDLGIGMVQFVNVITFQDTARLTTASVEHEIRAKFKEAWLRARELGLLIKVELFTKLPVQQCDFPWKRNFVTYDGHMHPCCYSTQTGDRAAQNQRSLGNLGDHPFSELGKSDVYSMFRSKLQSGILPAACHHCPKYVGIPEAASPDN